ncbi:YDG domain-containing protein [Janthinobacterium tructae]|nr:YDG domain-containing protein [Janthinobacterium tructae]
MNRIYRLVWSHVHQTWVAVHERARGKGKSANRRLIASVLLAASHSAMAGPTGGQVTAGNGTINQNGATTTVTQASQNLSLNWQSFNTSSGETVNFVQPSASAIAVNRIGGNSATQFYGALNANGQVYLINPNGVLFGAGSQINVGGLVASTLDTGDAGLGGATRRFTGSGSGSIINQGAINTGNGGYVAFIGNQVSNSGTINARAGTVALGAGSDVTLSFSGDSLVQLQVNQGTLNNLAENGGLINADGGAVWLSAGARDTVLASVVNNTGIIQARSVEQVGGTIVLGAGSAGTATNSGTLDAVGVTAGAIGGTVKVLGGAVTLAAGSLTDVSGDAGGGTALIGGNFLGAGAEQNAHTTTVAAGASIKADAMTAGNGGSVAVWSDGATQFNGSITARGGSTAGNGGQVETSGKSLNINASAAVNTGSPHGVPGDWLLDPDDITIGNNSVFNNGLNAVSYPINVDTRVLSAALNNGNVTIKTTGSSASCTGTPPCTGVSGNGDIIVLDLIGSTADYNNGNLGVLWESGDKTLTLSAYRDIYFKTTSNVRYGNAGNPSIDTFEGGIFSYGSGNVVLRADNTATGTGTVRFEGQHLNTLYLNDIRSTISIYYNPSSYNTPTAYGDYMASDPSQLTAYMAIKVGGTAASKIYDGSTTTSVSGLTPAVALPGDLALSTASAQATFANKNVGANKTVNITGIFATGTGAATTITSDGATVISYNGNNYFISGLDSKTATITAKTINLTGLTANSKTYDGTTSATLSGSASVAAGIVNGDSVTLGAGSATFADANADVGKAVTVTGYALTGVDAGNYVITLPTGLTANINKADLTLAGTKTYDGTTSVAGSTLTATGVAGQTFSVTGAGNASNLSSKNVQSGAALASITGLSLGSSNGGLASNYNAIGVAGSSYTVTAKGITLTGISALDKIYDATTTAALNTASVGYSGLINGDSVSLAGSGTGSFVTKNVGVNKAVTVSGYTLSGLDAGNYVVTQPTGLTASISKASLIVSGIAAANKTYDATTGAALSGTAAVTALGSDSVSVIGAGAGSFADANAGSNKAVSVTGYTLTGVDAGNYNLVQPAGVSATIHKADVIVSGSKTYDGTTSVAGSTLTATGVAGQQFSVTGAGDASNLSSKNVQSGAALASATGLSLGSSSNGGQASNYNAIGVAGSSYTVTAKGITLTGISALDKTYDATTTATLNTTNVAYSGLVGGDSVSLAGSGTGNFLTKNVGVNKPVTVSGYTLSGLDAGNYVVTQPTGLTASISKASLVVSGIAAANKTYDATTGAALSGTAAVTALGSDIVSVAGTGAGSFADANADSNKAVSVTGYTLTGVDAGNYDVVQPNAVTATIHKADVIVSGSKTYDGATSVAGSTLTATGVAGQIFSVTGAGDASNLSSKNVQSGAALASATGLSLGSSSNGGLASNYNAIGVAGSSYTVTAKGITLVGISALDKTYDATTTATLNTNNVAYSGLVGGDSVSLAGSGTSSFADKNAGANKAVTVSGYTLSGADAGNYVVTQPSGLTASISKASLIVSGIAAANKTYDATTGATLSGTAAVSALGSDSVSVIGAGAGSFADANAGSNKAVSVTGYTLTGVDAGNYDVVQPNAVSATIHKADVIVSGSKTYDGTTSVAGSTLTATGVAGQQFSVTGAGDASNLSSKNVQSGAALASATGLSLGSSSNGGQASNYNAIGVAGSSYTVTAKGITLTGISALDKTYDATTTATLNTTNVAYSGLVGGDSVSLAGSGTGSFADKNAGANKAVTVSGYTLAGLDAGNYVVTQPSGLTATINKAILAVSGIAAVDKTYDATTGAALSGTAAVAALGSDSVSVTGSGVGSFADKNAGANKAVTVSGYTLAGLDAGNYVVEQPGGLTATINKASLAVSGIAAVDKTYDATTGAALSGTAAVAALGSDSVSVTGTGVGSFADKNAGANKAVSVSGYTLAGLDAGNYVVEQPGGLTATINKASLAVSGIAAVDKTYDATTGAALSGTAAVAALGSDSVSVTGAGVGSFADKNAGANKAVTVSGYTLAGLDAGNYVVEQPGGLTATINKASLAVSGIAAVDKTYDATTGAALSGTAAVAALGSDSVSVTGTGVGSFADKNAGVNKAVTVSGYTLAGLDAGNYVVEQPGGLTATINKASLAVSGIAAVDKTYDATTGAALSGTAAVAALGSDSVSVTGTGVGSFADKNAGANKAVSVSGYTLAGLDAGNYVVEQPGGLTASINKASLAVSGIAAVDKTYDATTGATLSGTAAVAALGSDSVSVTGAGVGSFADKNAGANKAVTVSGYTLSGLDAGNYVVTQPGGLTASINKASLAVSGIAAVDKTYDATTGAALSGTAAVAALGSDSVSVTGAGVGSFADKNAGVNKAVTVSGYTLAGLDAGNYVVEQPGGLTASISKAILAVSGIAAVDKTYDATTGATLSGTAAVAALGSDSVSVTGAGVGSFADKNAGANKAVTVSGYTLSGLDAGNYVVTQPGGLTASINKASLAVSGIAAVDKTYDATTGAALSGTAAVAALGSDSVSVTGAGVGSFADKNAGANKAVTVSGYTLAGLDAGNYVVEQPGGLTATINKASLAVSGIAAVDKTYDATTGAALSGTAAVAALGSDSVSVTGTGVGSFADKNAGANKAVTVSGYTLAGLDAGNYVVEQPGGLTASINKASLAVSGIAAVDKTYDATTGAALSGTAAVAALGSDSVSVTGAGVGSFADKNAGANKAVTVSGYTLAGLDAGNYVVEQPGGLTASIARAALTVSGITAADKAFDGSTAATVSTANATLAGKFGSDDITLASTGQFSDAAAGVGKTVNLSSTYGGADIGNYIVTGQAQAIASITGGPVVVPGTPTPQVQSAVTQMQSSLLPPQALAQSQVLSLSTTLVVQQLTDSGSSNSDSNERSKETMSLPLINTATGFGTPAPLLKIQNGGMQLPLVATSSKE